MVKFSLHVSFLSNKFVLKVKQKIAEQAKRGVPVAGVIVEPIQGEGGDNMAHPDFFRGLQKLCKEVKRVFFIFLRLS